MIPLETNIAFYNSGINTLALEQLRFMTAMGHNSTTTTNDEAKGYNQTTITINGHKLIADLAITPEQRRLGLSVKNNLSENQAMLFVYEKEGRHAFWMMDMKFPIDIIWIDSNQTIRHIERSVPPCEPNAECHIYKPRASSLHVLETVSGYSTTHGLHIGTKIAFEDQPSELDMPSETNDNMTNQTSCSHRISLG